MGLDLDLGSLGAFLNGQAKSPATVLIGTVYSVDTAGNVIVLVGGMQQVAFLIVYVPLQQGDNVLVLRQDGHLFIVGPLSGLGLPITGTVTAVPADSDTITVTTSIGDVDCVFPDAYAPTAADAVVLWWAGTTPVAMKQGVTGTPAPKPKPPPPIPVPGPPSKPKSGTTTFQASSNGTFRAGQGWQDDAVTNGNVMAGEFGGFGLNDGAWFYNGRIHSSLAGCTVTKAQIFLGRASGGAFAAQTVHLYRVSNNTRPSGDLTFDGSNTHDVSLAVNKSGWFTLPNSMVQAVVDSGGSIGIEAPSGPYVRMWGLKQSGQAGALKITWRKS